MEIYYSPKSRTIQNEKGEPVTIEQAREFWHQDLIDDCNMAFHRLVMCEFDLDAVDQMYKDMEASK